MIHLYRYYCRIKGCKKPRGTWDSDKAHAVQEGNSHMTLYHGDLLRVQSKTFKLKEVVLSGEA